MPGPPVLLVHGLAASAATTWREAGWLDLLADAGRTVLAPDLPGHGGTPLPAPPAEIDLDGFVLDLLPPEPVQAIGFSLGANTILRAAMRSPERFDRIVLTGIGESVFRNDDALGTIADALEAGDADDPVARYFLEHARRSGADPLELARVIRHQREPITADGLAKVTMPVLVVIGERDFAGPGEPLAEALPDARCKTLRGVDHFGTPKDFGCLDAALAFLDALPGVSEDPQAIPQSGRIDDDDFPTLVLLVRHGESMPVVPGSPESKDPPLSPRGAAQAAAVAERLASAGLTAVYSSHLARAVETAAAIAEPHGLTATARPDLREVDLGEWDEGGFRQRAAEHDLDYLAFIAAGRWEVIPGAETDDALRWRMVAALDELAATHAGGRIAIVCHGGSINAWLAHRFGSHRSMIVSIDNTSITQLHTDGTNWLIRGVNDCNHLAHGRL